MEPNNTAQTVERSIEMLSEAVAKATEDLEAAQGVIAAECSNAASLDLSTSEQVVAAAKRTVDHLRRADQALRLVVSLLGQQR